jgi:chaperonin cofactor prefoldin
METKQKAKGSWGVRFFIIVLGIILGVLFYWLLSFIEGDIGRIQGPVWNDVRREFVSQEDDDNRDQLQNEVNQLNRRIDTLREQQKMLKSSTSSYQNTMNQLLSIQKQYIEKGQEFPAESVQTLQESQAAFLENQKKDQQFTQDISVLIEQRQQKEDALLDIKENIKTLEDDAHEKNDELWKKYRFKVAVFKLSFLVPVFLVISFLFIKFRAGSYWPLVWAAFVACFIKIALVAHEYFPANYFKYIAILVVLAIVLRMLVYLIRMIIAPKKDLLIKQYQQYYDKYLCPVCTKPIKAGPLRYAHWKKKATVLAPQGTDLDQQQSYTCPSCGTNLYDKCGSCGKIRHTLLPYCEHCGSEKQTTDNEK